MTPPPPIRFAGVGHTYPGPPPVVALHPCDLVIEAGDFVAVLGPSGSGKSTFINIVGLLDRPTQGRYELDGIDTGQLPERYRASLRGQQLGMVFQSFHLLPHRSARENVMLAMLYNGLPRHLRAPRADEALDRVGLSHRRDAFPTTLSGGERQRVAVARALVNGPSLLLCDEPTGALDSANAEAVMDMIGELHGQGQTIVVITHDPAVAGRGRRRLTIHDGRIQNALSGVGTP